MDQQELMRQLFWLASNGMLANNFPQTSGPPSLNLNENPVAPNPFLLSTLQAFFESQQTRSTLPQFPQSNQEFYSPEDPTDSDPEIPKIPTFPFDKIVHYLKVKIELNSLNS